MLEWPWYFWTSQHVLGIWKVARLLSEVPVIFGKVFGNESSLAPRVRTSASTTGIKEIPKDSSECISTKLMYVEMMMLHKFEKTQIFFSSSYEICCYTLALYGL